MKLILKYSAALVLSAALAAVPIPAALGTGWHLTIMAETKSYANCTTLCLKVVSLFKE